MELACSALLGFAPALVAEYRCQTNRPPEASVARSSLRALSLLLSREEATAAVDRSSGFSPAWYANE